MTHATTTTHSSTAKAMGNGNKKFTVNSLSADNLHKHSSKLTNNKDVTKWSSTDVQHWIKQQCKKFELKKSIIEQFEMNGQALVLLTKHDFLRRSPDGGEILYYTLQQLINPNKVNSANLDQSSMRNESSGQHPRIVEVTTNSAEPNNLVDSSSSQPIVEEPDDPPAIRRSHSDTEHNNYQDQQHSYPFMFNNRRVGPAVFTMPAGVAATYFHQQQGLPNAFMYAHHHHPHLHMPQQQFFFQPHLIQQYHPMMSARGILIVALDDGEVNSYISNGAHAPINGISVNAQEQLFLVTVNGQRYVMNEAQVRQLVTEVHQLQTYQEQQQWQQRFQQQQWQQRFQQQQQQQRFQQQQQQQPFQEQQRF